MFFFSLLPIAVVLFGGFMILKLRAFFIFHPIKTLRVLKSTLREKGAIHSLCLALAGTLGVGNIIGVAIGLIVGGAGSVFWLVVSSVFALALKYSEACISSDSAVGEGGGMIVPIKKIFEEWGGILSCIYASLALVLSFFMGGALQTVGGVGALSVSMGIDTFYLAVLFAIISGVALIIFKDKIKALTYAIIPLITLIYIGMSSAIIILNIGKLPNIISLIFNSAFNFDAAVGGVGGGVISISLREGFSRGLLSNEAGAGTSSFAHSEINSTPSGIGILGMCEVLFDTLILCPLTALAVLSVVPNPSEYSSGAELVIDTFSLALGAISSNIISICIVLFAFSTVACWFYYGRVCSDQLHLPRKIYMPLFIFFLIIGGILDEGVIVSGCDLILLFLTLITGGLLIKSSDRIKRLSELSGLL